jgi:diguanylate cyclase (GGDEF)-like protein
MVILQLGPDSAAGRMSAAAPHFAEEAIVALQNRTPGLPIEDSVVMNRRRMTEVLKATLADAVKLRSSCGFLLLAIDDLGRINEAHGYEVGDEVIAMTAQRIRSQLRGKDHLGRLSNNAFGVVLNDCTLDDILVAADRLVVAVRNEVIQTGAGPFAVTTTIGGVSAPRYARTVGEVLTRAQHALDGAKAKRRGSFLAYRPDPGRDAKHRENRPSPNWR